MPHQPRVARAALAAGALSLWVALLATPAAAQPKVRKDFEAAYNTGQDAFALGELDKARAAFEKARQIQPELAGPYRWLAAIAHTQERWEDCLREGEDYLTRAPTGSHSDEIRKIHGECRDKLGRPLFTGVFAGAGALSIITRVEGKEVEGVIIRIDGMRTGATRLNPRVVTTGKHSIDLEHPEYINKKVEVDVIPGIVVDLVVDMERDPNAKVVHGHTDDKPTEVDSAWVTFAVDAPSPTILVEGDPVTPDEKGQIEERPGTYDVEIRADGYVPWRRRVRFLRGQRRTVTAKLVGVDERAGYRKKGYLALGAAGVFLTSGVVFGILESQAREDAQDIYDIERQRPVDAMGNPAFTDEIPLQTRADLQDATDRAKRHRLVSGISLGLGAAALGVSVYYFVKERPVEREGFDLPIAVVPIGDGDGGVAGVGATYSAEVDW